MKKLLVLVFLIAGCGASQSGSDDAHSVLCQITEASCQTCAEGVRWCQSRTPDQRTPTESALCIATTAGCSLCEASFEEFCNR